MEGEVTVVVENDSTETPEGVAEKTADVVIDKAVEIADKIDEARQEGEVSSEEIREVKYSLDDIWSMLNSLVAAVGVNTDLLMGLSDQVASLAALEVAETVVTETEEKAAEVLDTAAAIEEVAPVKEETPAAITPQIREKKSRKWV